ncbi:MAG: IS1380 family transposase, partial [Acidobacteria bacterium]|nr:IS1380 family transposase [Acidobacteriota bacterium]
MPTQCTQTRFGFQPLARRTVIAQFDGGEISPDGGSLLLRDVEQQTGIVR